MKSLRGIHLFSLIVLLYFSLPNVSSLATSSECPDSDDITTIVESINDQLQLDRVFKRIVSYDSQTAMCIQLSLIGNKFTLDIVQLMRINATKLIVMGDGTIDINCTSIMTDLYTLRNIVQPISRASLVLFDGLAFNKCPVPILIEEVAVVMILNCVFIHHEHGAVNIFNSPKVIVKNCTFLNNTSSSFFTRKPFQGNAGGLSIGHNIRLATIPLSTVDILVTDCNFTYNHATPPSHLLTSLNGLQTRRIFSGRGGGLSIPVNITGEFNCTVNNSVFVNNFADAFGGGAYVFISEILTLNQTYVFGNNIFRMNSADFGGALCFASHVRSLTNFFQSAVLYNCTFAKNTANNIGGGIFLLPSFRGLGGTYVRFERCEFLSNSAIHHSGAVDVVSYNLYGNRQNQIPVEFVHCVFDDNFGADGATVSLSYYSGKLDNVTFSNQRGTAVRVVGTTINFNGPATFINNNAETVNGGAIFLISFSQIFLYHGANINFIGNTGSTGAAIIRSARSIVPLVFEKTYFNPLCFMQFENASMPPTEIKQVSTNFTANRAVVGSAIYTSDLALCSWYSYDPPYFSDEANVTRWKSLFYSNDNINTGHVGSTDQTLAVQTPAVDFILMNQTVTAYPGESIKLVMLSFDEQNYTTSDIIQIFGVIHAKNFSFDFSPKAATMDPSNPSIFVKYGIKSPDLPSEIVTNSTYRISVSAFRENFPQIQHFNLTTAPCPPGHVLHSTDEGDEYQCQCDNDNDQNIINCASDEDKIILKEGQWATYVDTGLVHGMLEYYHCPPGYCQCSRVADSSSICNNVYYYNDDDRQCVCDRKGYLCGKCLGDKGVSALFNKCVSCGKASILLVISLVILDIIVITSILICSTSIKSWLYPFLFYVQVTPYLAQYFPVTFSAVHPYLHYISSATSLYFPYDFCLYPGMTALVSYTLRYLPLLLAVIISLILYVANKQFKLGKNMLLSWSGLWVLIILLSTDVLNTSLSILNCPSLSDDSGSKTLRWFVDGTVECYVGSHLALALVAVLILVFYIILIIFVVAVVMKKVKRYWAFSMARILHEPYTDQYKWWAPVELVRRCVFIIAIIAIPGNLTVALLPMIILVSILIYLKPYKKMYISILESIVLIDILILLMIASVSTDEIFTDNSFKTSPVDECGNIDEISDHAVLLIPFYYAPLVLLLIVVTTKLLFKLKKLSKRSKFQHDYHTQSDDEGIDLISTTIAAHYWEF